MQSSTASKVYASENNHSLVLTPEAPLRAEPEAEKIYLDFSLLGSLLKVHGKQLAITFLCLAGPLSIIALMVPLYYTSEAELQLQINDPPGIVVKDSVLNEGAKTLGFGGPSPYKSQESLLHSTAFLQSVLSAVQPLNKQYNLGIDTVRKLRTVINGEYLPETELLHVNVVLNDPLIAQKFLTIYLNQYQNFYRNNELAPLTMRQKTLESQLTDAQNQLVTINSQLNQTMLREDSFLLDTQAESGMQAVLDLKKNQVFDQITYKSVSAEIDAIHKLLHLDTSAAIQAGAFSAAQDNPYFKLMEDLNQAIKEREVLSVSFTDDAPKIKLIDKRIQVLRKQIAALQKQLVGSSGHAGSLIQDPARLELVSKLSALETERQGIIEKRNASKKQESVLKNELAGVPAKKEQIESLNMQKQFWQFMVTQVKAALAESKIQEAYHHLLVVTQPNIAPQANFPRRVHWFVFASLISLIGAIWWVILRRYQQTIKPVVLKNLYKISTFTNIQDQNDYQVLSYDLDNLLSSNAGHFVTGIFCLCETSESEKTLHHKLLLILETYNKQGYVIQVLLSSQSFNILTALSGGYKEANTVINCGNHSLYQVGDLSNIVFKIVQEPESVAFGENDFTPRLTILFIPLTLEAKPNITWLRLLDKVVFMGLKTDKIKPLFEKTREACQRLGLPIAAVLVH